MNEAAKTPSEGRNAAHNAAADDAYARLEKDLTAVKTEIAQLSQQISDAVNALGAIAQTESRRGLRRARANMDALASGASEKASAATGAVTAAAQDAASSIGDTLADALDERPVASLALAMGIGFLIGVTWRR